MSICPSFALMIIFLIDSYWEINPNPKGVESMDKIKVSLDEEGFRDKPKDEAIGKISNRIGASIKEVSRINMKKFALVVGRGGYTFCPATFKDGKRSKDHFEQQQMFALDFDNKDPNRRVSLEEVKARAKKYDLPILFAYDTFSSTDHDKFRVVFLNDVSISHRRIVEAMQLALGTIFPEADKSCYTDSARMFFGGKGLIYYDDTIPTINVESIFRGLTYFLRDTTGNHYKEKLSRFSRETGIALNKNGLLDVTMTDDPTEALGASLSAQDGKISPSPIINIPFNIIEDGENFPKMFYRVNLNGSTNKSSVTPSVDRTDGVTKEYKNHGAYRSSVLSDMSRGCQLFGKFESGERDMSHDELFGLATNLKQVESGIQRFKEIQAEHPEFYDDERREKWERHLSYIRQQEYKPYSCASFCPYCKECNHGTNILSTVRPKPGMMERLPGYSEKFYSIEDVQDDTYKAISKAYHAEDTKIHIIKSQTGAGKSHSYLQLMSENPDHRFLVAASTNLLKNELYHKAIQMDIEVRKTPSLEEIKNEIPDKVKEHIERFHRSGQHQLVHPYIEEILKEKDIPCLRKYMKEREALKNFKGSVITTHRYLLSMDEERLKAFDAIIIDEDIIFKSIIPNQGEVPVARLEKLLAKTTDSRLSQKIKSLLRKAKVQSSIELDSLEWDDEDDKLYSFDLPSFCQAEQFYVRRSDKELNLKEDAIVYLKLPEFFKDIKYIMVSATVDEGICRQYFGWDRVDFYECKRAKYQGPLCQYPGRSMSRSSISSDPGIVRRLMNRFGMDEGRVITFLREKIGNLHFGNTEGSNTLEGQDIHVVGTPYHADFLYKLAAFTMGLDFDEDEEVEPQVVTHNGYRFRFTTFHNEDLRHLQFWMIESELEQAVGRARLLRNPCKVHLFSNFPLSQAKMVDGFDYSKE